MWHRFGRGWLRSPAKFCSSDTKKSRKNHSTMAQQSRGSLWPGVASKFLRFALNNELMLRTRIFCRYAITKLENRCSLNCFPNEQSRKLLWITSYKPTPFSLLINSRLFAVDNRFLIEKRTIVLIF
jgi:hypothetical protein